MNILDKVADVLAAQGIEIKKGFLPDKPDSLTAIFEYTGDPPEHHFSGTDFINAVQIRTRGIDAAEAFSVADRIAGLLNRYRDSSISITQSSPVLGIGWDSHNPQRAEYTVNFKIRRY